MCSLRPNPLVLRPCDVLAGFVGKRSRPPLDQIADIDLVVEHLLDSGVGPEMIDTPGIAAALLLIIVRPWGLDALLIQGPGNRTVGHAGGPHGEDPPDHRGGILVNDQMMLVRRVPLVTEGRVRPHKFTALRTGFPYRPNLFACVSAVKLVKQIQKTHRIQAAVVICGINSVVEGDKTATDGRKHIVDIPAKLNVVSAKPGKVLDQDKIDPLGLGIRYQPLDARTVEICPGIAVINIGVDLIPALVTNVLLKKELLRSDLSRINSPTIPTFFGEWGFF